MTTAELQTAAASPWTVEQSAELYRVEEWGKGYFAIDQAGHLLVRPRRADGPEIDLMDVVAGLQARGLSPPFLLRFTDILAHRLAEIEGAFRTAIADNDYRGRHLAVYPIKVNQQRQVVEEVYRLGSELGFGLEVGSKPELLAALGLASGPAPCPVICNGFKDDEYIEMVVLATKLGRHILPVIENVDELGLLLKHAERYQMRPRFGVRVKLATAGAGRWGQSAGPGSKFGLTVSQILDAVEVLRGRGMADCLELVHCHLGSQLCDIRTIKAGVSELAHVYVELARLGTGVRYLDVGGGLAVDYDGTRSSDDSSMNYTLEEYASDLVYRIKSVCEAADVDHPVLVTECGRAMVAYHSVLVFNVLGLSHQERSCRAEDLTRDPEAPQPIRDLVEAYHYLAPGNLVESYHDAVVAREEAMRLFSLGFLDLSRRAQAERLFAALCVRVQSLVAGMEEVPEELEGLERTLRDTYFCNFSLFQSVPDAWALRQTFPAMPIHRLDEEPTNHAVLADITCDSDGKIDLFPGDREAKSTLEVHPLREDEEYFLGVFLVGAYQETLGDLHNLFGDTHAVHLQVEDDGSWAIQDLIEGDTVREVLGYMQFVPDRLLQEMRQACERAVRSGDLAVEESRALLNFYRSGLSGYTYLEPEGD